MQNLQNRSAKFHWLQKFGWPFGNWVLSVNQKRTKPENLTLWIAFLGALDLYNHVGMEEKCDQPFDPDGRGSMGVAVKPRGD